MGCRQPSRSLQEKCAQAHFADSSDLAGREHKRGQGRAGFPKGRYAGIPTEIEDVKPGRAAQRTGIGEKDCLPEPVNFPVTWRGDFLAGRIVAVLWRRFPGSTDRQMG